jgi:Chlorophyll A-B binding protein
MNIGFLPIFWILETQVAVELGLRRTHVTSPHPRFFFPRKHSGFVAVDSSLFSSKLPHQRLPSTMKSIIAASLVASAVAFAPAQQSARTSVATEMAKPFSDALGAQAKFDRLRFVELKHGRICMLGVVGYLTNKAGIYLPGDIDYSGTKFSDLGSGWDASFNVPVAGALQILVFVGMLELGFMKDATGQNEFVGDFRNGAIDFGWDTLDSATQLKKRAIELNQGRAAQMGLLGLMVHDKLGNVDILLPSV